MDAQSREPGSELPDFHLGQADDRGRYRTGYGHEAFLSVLPKTEHSGATVMLLVDENVFHFTAEEARTLATQFGWFALAAEISNRRPAG